MYEKLNKFTAVVTDPYQSVAQWKQGTNKKVIGCVPMHIPEEIIHAAGMLPVVFWESDEPITLAYAHVQPSICGFARSVLDDAIKGKLDFLDGMVFSDCCLAGRGLAFLVERNIHPGYLRTIYLPHLLEQAHSKDSLMKELERFKTSLDEFTGQEITRESLHKSILTYNKNRALLRRLYDLRRSNPAMLKAKEVLAILVSSMLMLKEEHNELLEGLLADLERQKPTGDKKCKLVLSGSLCQAPRVDILDMIEEVGGIIVDDDMYIGSRYMITDARVDAEPIESLADRFLKMRRHCPTKSHPENDWGEQLVEVVRKSQAQGVITLQVKFCEPHYFSYPYVINVLTKARIRELLVEMEHEAVSASLGQLKTRVQAFIESISRRK